MACHGLLHLFDDAAEVLRILNTQTTAGGSLYATSLVAGRGNRARQLGLDTAAPGPERPPSHGESASWPVSPPPRCREPFDCAGRAAWRSSPQDESEREPDNTTTSWSIGYRRISFEVTPTPAPHGDEQPAARAQDPAELGEPADLIRSGQIMTLFTEITTSALASAVDLRF